MAIREFGTGEGSTSAPQNATRSASARAIEGDCSPTISALITAGRHRLECSMLHAEGIRERAGEPALGDLGRQTQIVRGIREGDVIGGFAQCFDELDRVDSVDRRLIAGTERGEVV